MGIGEATSRKKRQAFKKKECIRGVEDARFKARLVAKGYSQVESMDSNSAVMEQNRRIPLPLRPDTRHQKAIRSEAVAE